MLTAKIKSGDLNDNIILEYFPNERLLVNPCFEKNLKKCPEFETALELEKKMLKSGLQLSRESLQKIIKSKTFEELMKEIEKKINNKIYNGGNENEK